MSDFTDGMQEGELRVRLTCNLCGATHEGSVIVADPFVRDQVEHVIREYPDETLEAMREAVYFASGWVHGSLPDGGVVDVCPECQKGNLFWHSAKINGS